MYYALFRVFCNHAGLKKLGSMVTKQICLLDKIMTDLNNKEYIAFLTNHAIPLDENQTIAVDTIKSVETGSDDTVEYDTLWPDNVPVPLTLRRYQSQITYWQVEDPNKCDREWAVLRRLRLDGFPIPRPIARGLDQDQPYIIWRTPKGEAWADTKPELIE